MSLKKKVFTVLGAVAMLAMVAYASQANNEEAVLSDMAMENVEALATGEDPCSWGCLAAYGFCVCNGDHPLKEARPSEEEEPPGD